MPKKKASGAAGKRGNRQSAKRSSAASAAKKSAGAKKRAAELRESQSSTSVGLEDQEIERALVTGTHRADLERLFGVEDYLELRELATASRQVRLRRAPKVMILPGILGSKLGNRRSIIKTWNTLWLDFTEVIRGNLTDLSLDGNRRLEAFGVMLIYYMKLKLRLRVQGFDAEFYPYDWRLGIDVLGKQLARQLGARREGVSLVAHSMGGLVSRAAFAEMGRNSSNVKHVIMLGTPNHGSYVPAQVFRGTSETLLKLAGLDRKNNVEGLVDKAFATLDGLVQMLPFSGTSGIDFFNDTAWPTGKLRPRSASLKKAPKVHQFLEKVREEDLQRFYLIAGVNRDTAVSATLENGEFRYAISREGDGTVPLNSAKLEGIRQTYYIDEQHGALPNNRTVAGAVADLLHEGTTLKLPMEWSPPRERVMTTVLDSELRARPVDVMRGREPSMEEERHLLEEFLAPAHEERKLLPESDLPGIEALSQQAVVIGRRRQYRLDVTLAHGSIADVNAQAIMLGIYQGVVPSGAARALDEALDGEISRVVSRRLFSANTGEVFVLPVSRRRLAVDFIVFVGLGFYDEFSNEVLELASQNTARILLAAQITDFATIMMGSGSTASITDSLRSMLRGFSAGVAEGGSGQPIRSVTIAEHDETRFSQMKRSLVELAVSDVLDGIEITIEALRIPPPMVARRGPAMISEGPDPMYLIVRQDDVNGETDDGRQTLQASLLTAGGKATVITEYQNFELDELDQLLKVVGHRTLDMQRLEALGHELAALVLPETLRALLWQYREMDHPVVVLHDAGASRIPWEILRIQRQRNSAMTEEDYVPALAGGMSRRFMTDLAIAKWLEKRVEDDRINVLLVVDPTTDLPGAVKEGERILRILEPYPDIEVEPIWQKEATRARLLKEFSSGNYDIVHYAGHAFFDPNRRSRSGLICGDEGDERVLSGEDLAGIGQLPTLMFFNACEAGRIRGASRGPSSEMAPKEGVERVLRNVSLSEAFLRGGVANYIGTYWPVGDDAAEKFADAFYAQLLAGQQLGSALHAGRKAVEAIGSHDWADYMHYGDVRFTLKQTAASRQRS